METWLVSKDKLFSSWKSNQASHPSNRSDAVQWFRIKWDEAPGREWAGGDACTL